MTYTQVLNKYKSKIISASEITVNRADMHSNKLIFKPMFSPTFEAGHKIGFGLSAVKKLLHAVVFSTVEI